MTKKLTRLEAFQELSIQLARIEDKLNQLLEQNKQKDVQVKPISLPVDKEKQEKIKKLFDELVPKDVFVDDIQIPNIGYTGCARCGKWQCTGNCSSANEIRCYFDLHPEDRFKPISVSCPCKRCSAYSMSGGSIQSSEVKTVWINPRSTLDCVGTDSCKTSEEAWKTQLQGNFKNE